MIIVIIITIIVASELWTTYYLLGIHDLYIYISFNPHVSQMKWQIVFMDFRDEKIEV